MARRIIDAVGRALTRTDRITDHEHPHFHRGAQGNVAACYVQGCDRPKLDS
ncbi:MAG TPA: hypothetical protein VFG42_16080 [Baekduia sp.]|uniref:hypothetical protein n=1 Tax=Baekduia sp. TaxID=2600305 RepID=UPI002D796015|nr:hypothetical protein [Baekduia sp.]HET6508312.1 hypothetical protein [Baekduia sp.]